MFGWGQKRTAESKTEKYEIQNGKELSERYMSPVDFVTKVFAQKKSRDADNLKPPVMGGFCGF